MGFLDKAKAAANDLAAKADTALASSGMAGPGGTAGAQSPDRLLRDLGVLAWLELNGQPQPEGERERVVGALRAAEQRGALPLTLQTAPPPPPASVPPPPGAAAGQAPPPSGAADDGSAAEQPPVPASDPTPNRPSQGAVPPPPPPSWAKDS